MQQRVWTPTTGGHVCQTREWTWIVTSPRQFVQRSCISVPSSCAAAKLSAPVSSSAVELLQVQDLESALLWDPRKGRKRSGSPNVRDMESEERLRFDNIDNPDRVDAQLAALDKRTGANAGDVNAPTVSDCQPPGTVKAVLELCANGELNRAVNALTVVAEIQSRVPSTLLYRVIQRCYAEKNLVLGRRVDDLIVKFGYESDAFLGNHILRMYMSHGRLQEAMKVFTRVAKPNVFMWFSIISAQVKHGKPSQAIQLYHEMRSTGVQPNGHIFAAALQACARAGDVESGRKIHADVSESGVQPDSFVCSSIVDMYAKCGELEDARKVFDSMVTKDAVTWNALINGYVAHELGSEALALHAAMEQEGLTLADGFTYACLLKACTSTLRLEQGRQLHSQIEKRGLLQSDTIVGNALVNMYAKCGELTEARMVFDSLDAKDVVGWTAMINGYAEHGLGSQALTLYTKMEQDGLLVADCVTFACLLKACANTGALQQGRRLHSQVVERGLLEGNVVVGTCLVNMYAKCGKLEDARRVFDHLATKNAVTWNAMINGYAEHGLGQEALTLYVRMEQEGLILADRITYACLLKACASAGALHQGRQLHSRIVEQGLLEGDTVVGNCLVDMYAKCGKLCDARKVFDSFTKKDVVAWTAMISGYGTDNGHKAVACFEEMVLAGIQPDDATFTCLLAACSHEGLVTKGREYFDAMQKQHGVHPTVEHYNCMVDLLGWAGHVAEAEKMLLSVDCKNNTVGWMSLLTACKTHGNVECGTRCFDRLLELDPQDAGAYVLMANIYADANRWADADRIEKLRKITGASKKPAVADIEVNEQVHTFVVGDQRDDVRLKVRSTNARLKEEGHVPHTKSVLKLLSEQEKEDELCGHAEKLALAYGLLNTPDGTPLLVTKNLRMCRDCHASTAIMSRVEKRDIVVRDAYRVHRFEAGSCSCKGRR